MNERLWTVYRVGPKEYRIAKPGAKPGGELACYAVDEAAAKRAAAQLRSDEKHDGSKVQRERFTTQIHGTGQEHYRREAADE